MALRSVPTRYSGIGGASRLRDEKRRAFLPDTSIGAHFKEGTLPEDVSRLPCEFVVSIPPFGSTVRGTAAPIAQYERPRLLGNLPTATDVDRFLHVPGAEAATRNLAVWRQHGIEVTEDVEERYRAAHARGWADAKQRSYAPNTGEMPGYIHGYNGCLGLEVEAISRFELTSLAGMRVGDRSLDSACTFCSDTDPAIVLGAEGGTPILLAPGEHARFEPCEPIGSKWLVWRRVSAP